jgi:hypothetical protein
MEKATKLIEILLDKGYTEAQAVARVADCLDIDVWELWTYFEGIS